MTSFAAIDHWAKELIRSRRLPNAEICIFRQGDVPFFERYGHMDVDGQRPIIEDAIFRIYSMTKPLISAAVLMLAEEEKLKLSDPASKFIPEFANSEVVEFEGDKEVRRVAAERPVTIHDLMSHTAGLTYGGSDYPPVSTSYRDVGIDFSTAYASLADFAAKAGSCSLYYQPGSRWIYSIANDILGRIIEVASGMSLDRFFQDCIFTPLGMSDTAFHVQAKDQFRLVANTGYDSSGNLTDTSSGSDDRFLRNGTLLSGGSGLVSTSRDYMKFAKMLLANGSANETRLMQQASVELMTRNQLPGDLPSMGCAVHSEMDMTGIGYGYGGAVTIDQNRATVAGTNGDYGWGGVANTYFWVDPKEQMIVLFMSQLMPASDMPVRTDLRNLVYQALGR